MTAEEEVRSFAARDRIRGVKANPAPADLFVRLERLEALAAAGDRAGVRAAIGELIPSYVPTGVIEMASAEPEV